jgi:hypothetical protein
MQPAIQTASVSKKRLWTGLVLSSLPALFLILDGIMKLVKPAPVVEATLRPVGDESNESSRRRPFLNVALWIISVLLALLFLFAGGVKLVLPPEKLAGGPILLPVLFLRFLGVAEVLGALGLILPGLLRIRRELTPLAAAGLAIIMAGATVITLAGGLIAPAFFPLVLGLLAAFVGYSRWRLSPEQR